MAKYITNLQVSLNEEEEKGLLQKGFTQVQGNLNEGYDAKRIYLWYKKGQENAITRIQFSFHSSMVTGLNDAAYHRINKNLNEGAGGDTIYLWYYNGSLPSDVPFTDLAVALDADAEAKLYKDGYERLACDLKRRAGGKPIYAFVKRAKRVYISDITASADFEKDVDNFQKGYIRVDENTNREAGGDSIFIWYKLTTDDKQALKGPLQISITDEQSQTYKTQGYKSVHQDLNQGTGGHSVYLWYKKDVPEDPIREVSVIVGTVEVDSFERVGIKVINKNLNVGNKGLEEFLCFAESRL